MEKNNLLKIIGLVGFIVLACVSCWATSESLHMLLPSWPLVLCYAVTISFFIVASYGTKMIVDSLNQNIYVEHRRGLLLGGVVLTLVFWLFASMPTNTHTFLYHQTITDVITEDLATTKSYLMQLRDNVKIETMVKQKKDRLSGDVWAQVTALENEIDNIANPGFGTRSRAILDKIATTLQVASIPELSHKVALSPAEKKALKQQYRSLVADLLNQRLSEMGNNLQSPQKSNYKKAAEQLVPELERHERTIADMKARGEVDKSLIVNADIAVKKAYGVLRNYSDYVDFKKEDKAHYLADPAITRSTRLLSVVDVWKDYFAGRFDGRGFIFWILLSIVVDLGAFIFFDLAFKQRED